MKLNDEYAPLERHQDRQSKDHKPLDTLVPSLGPKKYRSFLQRLGTSRIPLQSKPHYMAQRHGEETCEFCLA